jgi:carboxylesterase type B
MLLFISYLSLVAVSLAKQNHETHNSPMVKVLNGSYSGIHHQHFQQDFFLGIPFAQPPIGDLRFRIPQSLNTSWTGLRDATAYGPACIGYGEDTYIGASNFTNEDCLTLNIVRPVGYEDCALPVGVWIHG